MIYVNLYIYFLFYVIIRVYIFIYIISRFIKAIGAIGCFNNTHPKLKYLSVFIFYRLKL